MTNNLPASKPFDMSFVLKITTRNMRRDLEISITKTYERIPEFADNREKSEEIFKTLTLLHGLSKKLQAFEETNSTDFRDTRINQKATS
jgi:hypothetical protein